MSAASTYSLTMPGKMLQRGFWLYVWRIQTADSEVLYVGRTGDNSSPYATPPYIRMGQHLGRNKNQNALRRQLSNAGFEPEECVSFEFISHGPLYPEQPDMESHIGLRDIVAALEKRLAEALAATGHHVLNTVNSHKPVDEELWRTVRDSFLEHFPDLRKYEV